MTTFHLPASTTLGPNAYAILMAILKALSLKCVTAEVPLGELYHVSSGDVWSVLALIVEGELRIDGEVHCWGDVTGSGIITGEGELRLH